MPLPDWTGLEWAVLERAPESPDREKALTYLVADAWVQFASAAVSAGVVEGSGEAARYADELTREFVKRFIKGG